MRGNVGVPMRRGQGAHKGSCVHDAVVDRLSAVDGELEGLLPLRDLLALYRLHVEGDHATYGGWGKTRLRACGTVGDEGRGLGGHAPCCRNQ